MGWFQKKGKQQQVAAMVGRGPMTMAVKQAWVIGIEHIMLRAISLVFSFVSAYAIAQVFSPSGADVIRKIVGYMLALGFGVLGYFLSRSIAYRLFQGQSVWAYMPICLVVELVEVFCNYVMGVSEIPHEQWLQSIPHAQLPTITGLAYIVLSIIPAVTLFLAVADMDLERRKLLPKEQPKMPQTSGQGNGQTQPVRQPGQAAPTVPYGQGYRAPTQGQGTNGASHPNSPTVPIPQRGQVGQGARVPLQGVTSQV